VLAVLEFLRLVLESQAVLVAVAVVLELGTLVQYLITAVAVQVAVQVRLLWVGFQQLLHQ
jgi:hypothetical protein